MSQNKVPSCDVPPSEPVENNNDDIPNTKPSRRNSKTRKGKVKTSKSPLEEKVPLYTGFWVEPEDNIVSHQENNIPKKKAPKEKKKAKLLNPALKGGDNKKKCEYCQVYLTDESFFDKHKGTKKHKRNLRKWKEQHEGGTIEDNEPTTSLSVHALPIQDVSVGDIPSSQFMTFKRKKYEGCFRTTNKDTEYITKLSALLSLQLALDDEVEDFYISVFNKKWLSYGDIVIEIIKHGKTEAVYAIKCKEISSNRTTLASFNDIVNVKKELGKLDAYNKNENFDKTFFAIFTTSQAPRRVSKKDDSSDDETPLTPSKKNEISDQKPEKLDYNEDIQLVKEKNHHALDISKEERAVYGITMSNSHKLLLFTCQHVSDEKITEILTAKFQEHPKKVTEDFKTYIRYWAKGDLGGEYKLRKIDTILKLTQLLLYDVITEPIVPWKHNRNSIEDYDDWNYIIKKVDLTILKNNQSVISMISNPIIKTIEHIFGTTIAPNQMLKLEENVDQSLDPEMKAYLFEFVRNVKEPIPLSKLFFPLWKADRIPMLIRDNDKWRDLVLKVICFVKEKGFKRGFIILSNDEVFINPNNDLSFINPDNDWTVVNPKKDLKYFKCLDNIKEYIHLNDINIQVSNGPSITLEQICSKNEFFLKWVTPDIFLNLSLTKCSIKGITARHVSEDNVPLQIIVEDTILEEIYEVIAQNEDNQEEKTYTSVPFGRLQRYNPALFKTVTLSE